MKTLDYLHLDEQKVQGVVSALHSLLADFQVFYTNLRGFHWDIEGHGFFVLHGKFEDLYDDTAEKADQIAERILMLGGKPENRFSEYLRVAKVKEISGGTRGDEAIGHILTTYSYLIGEERKLLALASEAGDEATVALMSDYLKEQEKMGWMLTAYNKKPFTGTPGSRYVTAMPAEHNLRRHSFHPDKSENGIGKTRQSRLILCQANRSDARRPAFRRIIYAPPARSGPKRRESRHSYPGYRSEAASPCS